MDTTINVIRQDLKVARNAIDAEEFGMVNVIGNRIMSNLLVEDREELMIIGWMLNINCCNHLSCGQKRFPLFELFFALEFKPQDLILEPWYF